MDIHLITADITTLHVDAIVNAANSGLLGGGGVDGAIHRAAGPQLLDACRQLRATSLPQGLEPGCAVATPGFDLPAPWVIHTVAPNMNAGDVRPETLTRCFYSCLEVAHALALSEIAFPALGAGVYGWDHETVAHCAIEAVGIALESLADLPSVTFCLFDDRYMRVWGRVIDEAVYPGEE